VCVWGGVFGGVFQGGGFGGLWEIPPTSPANGGVFKIPPGPLGLRWPLSWPSRHPRRSRCSRRCAPPCRAWPNIPDNRGRRRGWWRMPRTRWTCARSTTSPLQPGAHRRTLASSEWPRAPASARPRPKPVAGSEFSDLPVATSDGRAVVHRRAMTGRRTTMMGPREVSGR